MDFAALPDEPVASYRHDPAYAGRQGGQATKAANQRDADYLVHLLNQILRRIDDRIERYLRLNTIFEASHNCDYARTFHRLQLLEEQDREILEGLIDDLMRRFPPLATG